MAKYRTGNDAKFSDFADNEDLAPAEMEEHCHHDDLSIICSVFPLNGNPFSAVSRQLLPKYFEQAEELFDEFGFRKKEEDGDPTASPAAIETSQQRMKWLAHIQFTHENMQDELTWSRVNANRLRGTPKFHEMLDEHGIPHSLRPFLWPRLSGGSEKRAKSGCTYAEIIEKSEKDTSTVDLQIDKDLLRTLPNNFCFARLESLGTVAMRRILKAIAFMYPDLGYCQGMGVVVATLLLVCSEENAFWTMCALIEDTLPPNYYSHSLLGLRADERVVKHLIKVHMPELMDTIEHCGTDISMILINWLITLLASIFSTRMLLRIWDHVFCTGSVVIFRVIISMLKMNEERLVEHSASANGAMTSTDLFSLISQVPTTVTDVEPLLEMMRSFDYSITSHLIDELRKKHQGILMTENGMIYAPEEASNLPKQKVNRRNLSRSKSLIQQFFQQSSNNDGYDDNDPKTKNIRQTEIVVDLRNAISQICKHFAECTEEKHERVIITQADYSADSHVHDREIFLKARREGRKRGRALLDFERQEEDELGFKKNDLITIISEKDEHCWVGELDGQRGWFPAKFVEVIDERGKNYCAHGDEAANSEIVGLVRGLLVSAIRRILFHGIRSSSRITPGFTSHPWPFIEALSSAIVDHDPNAINSRLTLCDTFRLDQDGKILSPEELLFRAVREINLSHNLVNAQLDVKLRSLIVSSLNEQSPHLWFDILCNSNGQDLLRKKYYHSWSFIRSPISKQIKCELRILSQFSFNLNVDSETKSKPASKSKNGLRGHEGGEKQPLKENVRDMLIKHHLFSWDL
ncbi:rab-GTPase-TBC domain-containing protein [Ditylenchus destructor]|nr:rab-GTPase-TBC domain-containing protein [Ditylenchus destructor]